MFSISIFIIYIFTSMSILKNCPLLVTKTKITFCRNHGNEKILHKIRLFNVIFWTKVFRVLQSTWRTQKLFTSKMGVYNGYEE